MPDDMAGVVARVTAFCDVLTDCGASDVGFDIDGQNVMPLTVADLRALVAEVETLRAGRARAWELCRSAEETMGRTYMTFVNALVDAEPMGYLHRMDEAAGFSRTRMEHHADVIRKMGRERDALRAENAQLRAACADAARDRERTCEWSQDGWCGEGDSTWETECGNAFTINDGPPTENRMAFCCYCGGKLVEVPLVPDEDDDADAVRTGEARWSALMEAIRRVLCVHAWHEFTSLVTGRRVRRCLRCQERQEQTWGRWEAR